MKNKNIEDYLNYYISSKDNNSAIFLDGEWGAGKTHFINNYINEHGKDKFLYVSLYGVKNISEIEDQFFQQLHPYLSSKAFTVGAKILSSALKLSINVDLDGTDKKDSNATINTDLLKMSAKDLLDNKNNRTIVFDDLERMGMQINNFLGYANQLVEHGKNKLIIIGHEEKIRPVNEDEFFKYSEIKEKLISRSFRVISDFDSALFHFIKNVSNKDAKIELEENVEKITYLYNRINSNNLRSLKQAISEFERFYSFIPQKYRENKELISEVLEYLLIFTFETRSGLLPINEIQYLSLNSVPRLTIKVENKSITKSEESLFSFYKKYSDMSFFEIVPSEYCWYEFFELGTIDSDEIIRSFEASKYYRDDNREVWMKLWGFYDLDVEEFEEVKAQVMKKLINGEYRSPGVIRHIFGMFLHFSRQGICNIPVNVLKSEFDNIIDDLQSKDLILYEETAHGLESNSYYTLGFYDFDSKEFNELSKKLEKHNESLKEHKIKLFSQNILSFLESDVSRFWQEISPRYNTKSKNTEEPIFKFIEPSHFIDVFLKSFSKNSRIISLAFRERYDSVYLLPKIVDELDFLENVNQILADKLKQAKSIDHYRLKNFIDEVLLKAIENVTNARNSLVK